MNICKKCNQERPFMPKRKICSLCYNAEKVKQRKLRQENISKTGICSKCNKECTYYIGKWCKDCKNKAERERRKKQEISDKKKLLYYKNKLANYPKPEKPKKVVCNKCNVEKNISDYYMNKQRGTVRPTCKQCLAKQRKKTKNTINYAIYLPSKHSIIFCICNNLVTLEPFHYITLHHTSLLSKYQ
jgi:hypothetical protein